MAWAHFSAQGGALLEDLVAMAVGLSLGSELPVERFSSSRS
jgi:hypothetical protein